MNVGKTSSHSHTTMGQIWYAHIKRKSVTQTRSHVKNTPNLTLTSKVKVILGSQMYATHRLMVIHPCAKYGMPMSKDKNVTGWIWSHVNNTINLTWRSNVKGQGHTQIFTVCNTSPHGVTPMCQIWYANVKEQKNYRPNTNLHRQMDRQSDTYIPPELCLQGYNKWFWSWICHSKIETFQLNFKVTKNEQHIRFFLSGSSISVVLFSVLKLH